jgi:hypothetical protein
VQKQQSDICFFPIRIPIGSAIGAIWSPHTLFAFGAASVTGMLFAFFKILAELRSFRKTTEAFQNATTAELRAFQKTTEAFQNATIAEFAELRSFRKTTEAFQNATEAKVTLLLKATGNCERIIGILTEEVTRAHLINEGSFSKKLLSSGNDSES